MIFHNSVKETILFDFWIIDDLWSLLLSVLIIFLLSFSYEGLKYYRDYLYQKSFETVVVRTVEDPARKNKKFPAGASKPNHPKVPPVIITQTTCHCPPNVPCEMPIIPPVYSIVPPPSPTGSTQTVITIPSTIQHVHKVKMLSWFHGLQLCLYMVQVLISYILMLIFMSFNIWLCVGILLGSGTGYFVFGCKKSIMVDIA